MGSRVSKEKHPTVGTKTVIIPRIPQEVVGGVLDHLATDSGLGSIHQQNDRAAVTLDTNFGVSIVLPSSLSGCIAGHHLACWRAVR